MATISFENNGISVRVRDSYEKDLVSSIPGRSYDPSSKAWRLPCTQDTVNHLEVRFPDVDIPIEVNAAIDARVACLKLAHRFDDQTLVPVKGKPYQHQREAFDMGRKLLRGIGAFGLWHEMGCGKTLTATALVQDLTPRRVLVVCPATVIPVWPMEFTKWLLEPPMVTEIIGAAKKRERLIKQAIVRKKKGTPHTDVLVLNYEILGRNEKILSMIQDWQPDMIICDEAHRIKDANSRQSKAIKQLGNSAKYRLAMTGSPVSNITIDIFGLYKWLDESIFGGSFTAFKARYAHQAETGRGVKFVTSMKADMIGELANKMHSIAHRVSKADALDLPEETETTLPVELEPAARRAYEDLKKDSLAELESGDMIIAPHMLTKLLRLQQVAGGFVEDKQVSSAKLKALGDLLTDRADDKTVIFAKYTAEIRAIEELCQKRRMKYVMIDGSVAQKHRGGIVDAFQNDGDVKVFIAQTRSAGLGITLHAADTAVFYSHTHSLADHEQAKARIHRSGQVRPVEYIHLVASDTIDRVIVDALSKKQDVAKLVTDDWKRLL